MRYSLKPSLHAAILLICASLCQSAIADEGKACLSGVCVGATIDQIPPGLKWKIDPLVNPAKMKAFYSDWDQIMARNIKASPDVLRQLGTYRNLNGTLDTLNNKVIAALQHINGTCFGLQLTGEFESESGYRTVVIVKSYANQDGKPQQLRVSRLVRYYNSPFTDDQREKLAEELEAQFRLPVGANFIERYNGRTERKVRPPNIDEPSVYLKSGVLSGTELDIDESISQNRSDDRQAYLLLPGCTKAVSIN